jgi:hypothetical protein
MPFHSMLTLCCCVAGAARATGKARARRPSPPDALRRDRHFCRRYANSVLACAQLTQWVLRERNLPPGRRGRGSSAFTPRFPGGTGWGDLPSTGLNRIARAQPISSCAVDDTDGGLARRARSLPRPAHEYGSVGEAAESERGTQQPAVPLAMSRTTCRVASARALASMKRSSS